MQNRYTGDIGDFAKYGLLRALVKGYQLGIAWYLFPDESHNSDGKHTAYLDDPEKWRGLDPILFDSLKSIVHTNQRKVDSIEASRLLSNSLYFSKNLSFEGAPSNRSSQRAVWFNTLLAKMSECSIVFADPDNGLCEDQKYEMSNPLFWKRMPLSEACVLSAGRIGVIYHHNSRYPGGHSKEIQYWLNLLGSDAIALYWKPVASRTFFIVHPTVEIRGRALELAHKWSPYFEFHTCQSEPSIEKPIIKKQIFRDSDNPPVRQVSLKASAKACPECGNQFTGKGWGGIDAHWKSYHEHIMPYEKAWPIIKKGGRPSALDGK